MNALEAFARLTVVVNDIEAVRASLVSQGVTVVRELTVGPQGTSLVVQHPDGLTVEYLQPVS